MSAVGYDSSAGGSENASSAADPQALNPERWTLDDIQIQINGWLDGHEKKPEGVVFIPPLQHPGPKADLLNPKIIHIGPYYSPPPPPSDSDLHHQLKLGFLHSLCSRAPNHQENGSGSFLELCAEAVRGKATDVMAFYDKNACQVEGEAFVKMMVIDGSFLVEYLHRNKEGKLVMEEKYDLLSGREYLIPQINDDLLLLKNQLPFSLLKEIHLLAFSEQCSEHSFESCTLNFVFHMLNLHTSFDHRRKRGRSGALHFPKSERKLASEAFHFLDLYRKISIDIMKRTKRLQLNPCCILKNMLWKTRVAFWGENVTDEDHLIASIPSATSLHESGIMLNGNRSSPSALSVEFKHGSLDIPFFVLNLSTLRLLKNLSAMEMRNHKDELTFTSYIRFMDHIIDTKYDIELLQRNGIIIHTHGSHTKAAEAFNGLIGDESPGVSFNAMIGSESQGDQNYLSPICKEINRHYRSTRRMVWVSFKKKYFKNPWTFIALISTIFFVLLALVETFYTVLQYYHPHDHPCEPPK